MPAPRKSYSFPALSPKGPAPATPATPARDPLTNDPALDHRSPMINRAVLRWTLEASEQQLLGPGNRYAIAKDARPGDRRLLLVAHCDRYDLGSTYCDQAGGTIISSSLDDRLGVYLARMLRDGQRLALPTDVLLTTDEERGRSSAAEVPPELLATYLAFIELDRRGGDAVTYGLDSGPWLGKLKAAGLKISEGSFSDICSLPASQCAVNIGIGYHQEHSAGCYLNELELDQNLERLVTLSKMLAKDPSGTSYTRTPSRWDRFDNDWWSQDNRTPTRFNSPWPTSSPFDYDTKADLDQMDESEWVKHMEEQDLIQDQINADLEALEAKKQRVQAPKVAALDRRPRRPRRRRRR